MGYSAGEGGSNPSFDFFGRRDPDQSAVMEKRKKDTMATDSPFEVGGDSGAGQSPLLAALQSAPQRSIDYGDPRRGQGMGSGMPGRRPLGPESRGGWQQPGGGGYGRFPGMEQGMGGGWQGGYGRNSGGGQQQFYAPGQGPRQGQGLALGSGGTGYNPYAPNPNATRRG